MPLKRPSNISLNRGRRKFRYFVDRNLGFNLLPDQLRRAGIEIVVHDDIYPQNERDPWIFYQCGVQRLVVITSDTDFRKSFPHMAAVVLGKTCVIAFSRNDYKSEVRGSAFIKARAAIEKALRMHKGRYFIGVVGMNGDFRICSESPLPSRKTCDPKDWNSFEQVCRSAGRLPLAPPH